MVVDWLPWSHTFGGNHNFDLVLFNGGSLYIDDGKPTPPGDPKTARNLREIAPTIYFNVPKGYEALVPHLRADEELREQLLQPPEGAVLCRRRPQPAHLGRADRSSRSRPPASASFSLVARLDRDLAAGARLHPASSTGPAISGCRRRASSSSSCRTTASWKRACAGRNITPGYWRQPQLTRDAFDDEGFYKIGDALQIRRPGRPRQGPAVRRPHCRRFQALDRHLGQCRAVARAFHRPFCALCARRGVRRRRPRRHRGAGVSRHRGVPQARPVSLPTHRPAQCSMHARVRDEIRTTCWPALPRTAPARRSASPRRSCWRSRHRSTKAR